MLTYCQILKIVTKDEISVFFMIVEFWLLCVNGLCFFFFCFVSEGSLVPSKGINSDY